MRKFWKKGLYIFREYWPILLMILFELVLVTVNVKPNTWLVGWDNTMPELNMDAAFGRHVSAVWQEYRGLGVVDGMAHAANILHNIYIWLLMLVLPANLVRYVFLFMMHLFGGIGAYVLIRFLLRNEKTNKKLALLGGLFYLFNPTTIQMFYAPLELFAIHFGFLPWLIWSVLRYFSSGNKKDLLWVFILNLLAVPQAHVPTIFVVYCIALMVLSFSQLFRGKIRIKRFILVFLVVLLTNIYWLLPFGYSALRRSETISQSTVNLLSNSEIRERNDVYGTVKNVALMRGFSLSYEDTMLDGTIDYQLRVWRDFWMNPYVELIGWLFFGLLGLGLVGTIFEKNKDVVIFIGLFLVVMFGLGSRVPVFGEANQWFRDYVPLYEDVFRFAFTKYATLYGLVASVLIVFGARFLFKIIKKRVVDLMVLVLSGLIIFYASPVLSGNFFYDNLQLEIPEEYFSLFSYFEEVSIEKRIAILPQPDFWSWEKNEWGHRGSGFVWQGVKQPMMHRAFDPWSVENETYYWQLNNAITRKDFRLLESVFKKYGISYVVLDKSIVLSGERDEKTAILENMLAKMGRVDEIFSDNLIVYELYDQSDRVFSISDYETLWVNTTYIENDQFYSQFGDYVVSKDKADTNFPFSGLGERSLGEFYVDEGVLIAPINVGVKEVHIPDKMLFSWPILVRVEHKNNEVLVTMTGWLPGIGKNDNWLREPEKVYGEAKFYINRDEQVDYVFVNNEALHISDDGNYEGILMLNIDNSVKVRLARASEILPDDSVKTELIKKEVSMSLHRSIDDDIVVSDLYQNDIYVVLKMLESKVLSVDFDALSINNCDSLNRGEVFFEDGVFISSEGGSLCSNAVFSYSDYFRHFIFSSKGNNFEGLGLRIKVYSVDGSEQEYAFLGDDRFDEVGVVSMSKPKEGVGVSFENRSIPGEISKNYIEYLNLIPIQWNWFENIFVGDKVIERRSLKEEVDYMRMGVGRYVVSGYKQDQALVLSESFDDGWVGYLMDSKVGVVGGVTPWFFGERLEHVKVNGWANGFVIPEGDGIDDRQVVIVFWPQYLEWGGLLLLVLTPLYILSRKRKNRSLS